MPRDIDAPRETDVLMPGGVVEEAFERGGAARPPGEAAHIRAAAARNPGGRVPVARLLPQQSDIARNISQDRIKSILGGRERMIHESEIRLRQLG